MVALVKGYMKRFSGREGCALRVALAFVLRSARRALPARKGQFKHLLLQGAFIDIGHHGKNHLLRDKVLLHEAAEHIGLDLFDAGRCPQDGRLQRGALEEERLEAVVDVLGGVVLVGDDLVQHHAALGFDLVLGEGGLGGQFEQQARRFLPVLLEDGGVQHNLFLGGVGVEFAAQLVQVAVDDIRTLAACSAEHRVLHKVRDAGRIAFLVARSTADGERAESHRAATAAHGVSQSLRGGSCRHLFRARRLRSSGRKPAPLRASILCLEM